MFTVQYQTTGGTLCTSPVFHVRDVMVVKQSGLNLQQQPVPVIVTEFLVFDLEGKFQYVPMGECTYIETDTIDK
jgi:hypothetical protein